MRLAVAALFSVLMLGSVVSTQAPAREPQSPEAPEPVRLGPAAAQEFIDEALRRLERERQAELERLNQCTLPDGTSRRVDTSVVFNGWTYRCVEVLGSHFERIGAGWTRLPAADQRR
jgi:hypothetical protein